MPDQLFDDRPFYILTIVDFFTQESLRAAPRTNSRAHQIVGELDCLCRMCGNPRSIRVYTGPNFADWLLDH